MKKLIIVVVLYTFSHSVYAQSPDEGVPPLLLGIGGGVQFAWHSGAITTYEGAYECCTFADGTGAGMVLGARGIFHLSGPFSLRAGIGMERHDGEFSSVRLAYPMLSSNNTVEYVDLDEALDTRLSSLTLEAEMQYLVLSPGLYLSAGPALHIPMTREWTHTTTITAPSDVRFLDGSTSRTLVDGEIPDASPWLSLRLGAGALLPVTSRMYVNPEVLYSIALSNVRTASSWSVAGFQITLGMYVGL
jgi:hypothetical protein